MRVAWMRSTGEAPGRRGLAVCRAWAAPGTPLKSLSSRARAAWRFSTELASSSSEPLLADSWATALFRRAWRSALRRS